MDRGHVGGPGQFIGHRRHEEIGGREAPRKTGFDDFPQVQFAGAFLADRKVSAGDIGVIPPPVHEAPLFGDRLAVVAQRHGEQLGTVRLAGGERGAKVGEGAVTEGAGGKALLLQPSGAALERAGDDAAHVFRVGRGDMLQHAFAFEAVAGIAHVLAGLGLDGLMIGGKVGEIRQRHGGRRFDRAGQQMIGRHR